MSWQLVALRDTARVHGHVPNELKRSVGLDITKCRANIAIEFSMYLVPQLRHQHIKYVEITVII